MKTHFDAVSVKYDGSQLCPGWIAGHFGFEDKNVAVAFTGACDVSNDFMVDMADLEAGLSIKSDNMVHFIIEHEGIDLMGITFCQRLFVCIVCEVLEREYGVENLTRSGDDIFIGSGKLSISVATVSPGAAHIHTALNIVNDGTPVETACLTDLGVDPEMFARKVLDRYANEFGTVCYAASKVKRY